MNAGYEVGTMNRKAVLPSAAALMLRGGADDTARSGDANVRQIIHSPIGRATLTGRPLTVPARCA